jgi:hypothetical protein
MRGGTRNISGRESINKRADDIDNTVSSVVEVCANDYRAILEACRPNR